MTGKGNTKNWRFSGNIYTPLTRITSSNYTTYGTVDSSGNLRINLESTKNSIQIESIPNTYKQKITLPDPEDSELGCEITILNISGSQIQFINSRIYNGSVNSGSVGPLFLENNEFVKLKVIYFGGDVEMNIYIVTGGGSTARERGKLPAQLP